MANHSAVSLAFWIGFLTGFGCAFAGIVVADRRHRAKPRTVIDYGDIRVFEDGNQWCALRGENLQEGEAAFGDTPMQAIGEFLKKYPASVPSSVSRETL